MTFWRYQRPDIDVSIYVTTLNALQCVDSQILNTMVNLMLTNELYSSRFAMINFIGHPNGR